MSRFFFETNTSNMSNDQLWIHYESCLKLHDWSYDYSDDFYIWEIGSKERHHINNLLLKLGQIDSFKAQSLYDKYSYKGL
jgi:hypothetical protein